MTNPITKYRDDYAPLLESKALDGVIWGKDKILLFRVLGDTEAASKLAFQTSHTFSFSPDKETIKTKDGNVIRDNGTETEVSIEAIQKKGDPLFGLLTVAVLEGLTLEVWEVTVDEDLKTEAGYPAAYARGQLTAWEWPAGAEEEATVTGTLLVEGKPKWGYTPLSADQETAVEYAFRDAGAIPTEA
ncbi:phage major tail protein, TP901-1 family [Edaphobacillus lindanitolerans]|uniref:Phage major tail protein, TP901-1 family n=1 Tax=Edaphobacillus lindanitolerans TaxID=550447 RepID=A0A1U7PQP6_9BACI|nr:phage major tail protein, TP901-1 family [Edaphobacillus lindanitolerans]SIT91713.1 phage major tail protein, TP901-1 family [Edaphobacillus lindanitolerans]